MIFAVDCVSFFFFWECEKSWFVRELENQFEGT